MLNGFNIFVRDIQNLLNANILTITTLNIQLCVNLYIYKKEKNWTLACVSWEQIEVSFCWTTLKVIKNNMYIHMFSSFSIKRNQIQFVLFIDSYRVYSSNDLTLTRNHRYPKILMHFKIDMENFWATLVFNLLLTLVTYMKNPLNVAEYRSYKSCWCVETKMFNELPERMQWTLSYKACKNNPKIGFIDHFGPMYELCW